MGNYNRLLPGGDLEYVTLQLRDEVDAGELTRPPVQSDGFDQSDEEQAFYYNVGGETLRQTTDSPEA